MKRLIVISGVCFFICLKSSAQTIAVAAVPSAVKASFGKLYPGMPATWEKEGKNYEAGFKEQGHVMSVLLQPDGTLVETEKDIQKSELPPLVQAGLDKRYKGKDIKEYAMITKAAGDVQYEAEVNGKDVLLNKEGKFLSEVKD